MREKIAELINVKSIVTVLLTAVFCIMTLKRYISSEQYLTVFTTVIAFYFGTQHQKNCDSHYSEKDENK